MSSTIPIILVASRSSGENDCACADAPILEVPVKEGENDCACTPSLMPKVYMINPTGNDYKQAPDLFSISLLHGFHLAMTPFAPGGPIVLNQPAWERWQTFAVPRPLVDKTDHALAKQKLIQPAESQLVWQQPQPQTLTTWLHVTNACDLDCPYCYVRKSSARMSEEVGRKAIEAVFDTAVSRQFRQVKLKYAGGEATVHFRMIRTLHALAQKYSAETGIGL